MVVAAALHVRIWICMPKHPVSASPFLIPLGYYLSLTFDAFSVSFGLIHRHLLFRHYFHGTFAKLSQKILRKTTKIPHPESRFGVQPHLIAIWYLGLMPATNSEGCSFTQDTNKLSHLIKKNSCHFFRRIDHYCRELRKYLSLGLMFEPWRPWQL